jgi:hypothetical protein
LEIVDLKFRTIDCSCPKSAICNPQSEINKGGYAWQRVLEMMKQARVLQEKMAKMQEELGDKMVESSVGGGMVVAKANGRQELLSIDLEPEVVDPDDIEMLQDLIVAAVNDVLKRSQEMAAEEMSKLTGGLKLPGGMKMPGLF